MPVSFGMCAKAAYAAGCREVIVNWGDELLGREKYLHAADDVFDSVPEWRVRFSTDYARGGAAFLHIFAYSSNFACMVFLLSSMPRGARHTACGPGGYGRFFLLPPPQGGPPLHDGGYFLRSNVPCLSSGEAMKEYRQLQMSNAVPWSIGAIPVPSWAKKVFPDVSEEEAMNKLWDAIFRQPAA